MRILQLNSHSITFLFFNLVIISLMEIRFTVAARNLVQFRRDHDQQNNIFQQTIELSDLETLIEDENDSISDEENEVIIEKSKEFPRGSYTNLNYKKNRNDKHKQNNNGNIASLVDSATYIRTSIPLRIFQCIRKLSILRCMKLFLLQKMESKANFTNTGNLTKDFMEQFFNEDKNYPSLTDKRYKNVSDTELTNRLIFHFQKFFKDRDIKLHFIPGVMVQVVPSTENKIKLTVKKNKNVRVSEDEDNDYTDIITARRSSSSNKHDKKRIKKTKKHNYKHTMIQMAVPVLMMPAILLGTFLPFILPAFKMATIMSAILNKGALLAALLYAARTTALNNEAEIIHYAYNHPGYH